MSSPRRYCRFYLISTKIGDSYSYNTGSKFSSFLLAFARPVGPVVPKEDVLEWDGFLEAVPFITREDYFLIDRGAIKVGGLNFDWICRVSPIALRLQQINV